MNASAYLVPLTESEGLISLNEPEVRRLLWSGGPPPSEGTCLAVSRWIQSPERERRVPRSPRAGAWGSEQSAKGVLQKNIKCRMMRPQAV